jgi:hypothetical protein
VTRALRVCHVLRITDCVEPVTGWTCAHYAAACESDAGARLLAWLWSHASRVNRRSLGAKLVGSPHSLTVPVGSTSLHVAAAVGHHSALRMLLLMCDDAFVQVRNAAGQTARDMVQLRPPEERAAMDEEFQRWQQRWDADHNQSGVALAHAAYVRARLAANKQPEGATSDLKQQLIGAAFFRNAFPEEDSASDGVSLETDTGTPASEIRSVSPTAAGARIVDDGSVLIILCFLLLVCCSYASFDLIHGAVEPPPDSESASSAAAVTAAAAALVSGYGAAASDDVTSASRSTDVPLSSGQAADDRTAQLSTDAAPLSGPGAAGGMDVAASGISGKGSASEADSQQQAAGDQADASAANPQNPARAIREAEDAAMAELMLHVQVISDHVIREGTAAWDPMFPGSLVSEWQPEELRYLMPVSLVWIYDAAQAAQRQANLSLCPYQRHMPLLPMMTCSVAGDGDCAMHSILMQVASEQSTPAAVASARDTVLRVERILWNGRVPTDKPDHAELISALAEYREW